MQSPRDSTCAITLLIANYAHAELPVEFHRDIKPILSENCFQCHGREGLVRLHAEYRPTSQH